MTPSPESITNPVSKPETSKEILKCKLREGTMRMHIDEGRASLPRELMIKEAQVSPISKPC